MSGSGPEPGASRIAVGLYPRAERAVRRGHPWVFDQGIRTQRREGRAGDLAVIFDRDDRFLAIGLYDPASRIRIRILHRGAPAQIDASWFAARLAESHARREILLDGRTTGYRVVHGENDGLPGLIVDFFTDTATAEIYTAAWLPHLGHIVGGLRELLEPGRIVLRLARTVQSQTPELRGHFDGETLFGSPAREPVLFLENGLHFETDLVRGQKTGFFLDQRDNRSEVGRMAAGRRVLNVFSYTGGFSVYAARGGATEVTSLDLSAPALSAAARNFAHNNDVAGVAASTHHTLQGDAFELLEMLRRKGERYDMVVLDPPAFARSAGEVDRALKAYRKLTGAGLGVLAPGGALVNASCSSRIGAEQFAAEVEGAARAAGRPLSSVRITGHPVDHPVGFAEGAYLKCLFGTA